MKKINWTDKPIIFGRLTTVGLPFYLPVGRQGRKALFFNCVCECGTKKTIRHDDLRSGKTLSCKCYIKDVMTTHGQAAKTITYKSWESMRARCNNPKNEGYKDYGDRGITVCKRWDSFENFYVDMGDRPSKQHSLERKDVNGNYEQNNCKWATKKEQARNTRNNVFWIYDNKTYCISEWAEILKINKDTLYSRVYKSGWTVEQALTTPVRTKSQRVY